MATGDIFQSFNPTQSGALLCDGSTHAIDAANQTLATLLGAGPSDTEFTVPDASGRYLKGGSNPGNVGGEASVMLTEANLPAHSHDVNVEANGECPTQTESSGFLAPAEVYAGSAGSNPQNLGGVSCGNTGSGSPVAIDPPHVEVLTFIRL